jgi:hypothetical protein
LELPGTSELPTKSLSTRGFTEARHEAHGAKLAEVWEFAEVWEWSIYEVCE